VAKLRVAHHLREVRRRVEPLVLSVEQQLELLEIEIAKRGCGHTNPPRGKGRNDAHDADHCGASRQRRVSATTAPAQRPHAYPATVVSRVVLRMKEPFPRATSRSSSSRNSDSPRKSDRDWCTTRPTACSVPSVT